MSPQVFAALAANTADLPRACAAAGIALTELEGFIVDEMARAGDDWNIGNLLLTLADRMADRAAKVRTLNCLLLVPTHEQHQAVAMEIQQMADPASVTAIRTALARGFGDFAYTCSDDNVIAKWFSHALWKIGTPEAIAVIREYAQSPNVLVAEEMNYRLERISEATPHLLVPQGAER